jgi:hypothetical protein
MGKQPLSNNSFKEYVKELCEKPLLDDEKLNALMQLQKSSIDGSTKRNGQSPFFPRLSMQPFFACIALIIIISTAWILQPNNYNNEIAEEVVKNHLKLKPLDLHTQSIKEIQSFFTQLDFAPLHSKILSENLKFNSTQLLGGRYCSIKGVTAVQLRYRIDGTSTFYQVPYKKSLHGKIPDASKEEAPNLLEIKGLAVRLWQEKGLLMILVSPPKN